MIVARHPQTWAPGPATGVRRRRAGSSRPSLSAGSLLSAGPLLAVLLVAAGCSSPSSGLVGQELSAAQAESDVDPDQDLVIGPADEEPQATTVVTRPTVSVPAEWPSEIEAVYGRYWLYWEAFAAAYGPPNVDPDYQPLRALSTDANWTSLQEQMGRFVDDELVLVLPRPSITEHMIRIPNPAVLDGEEGSEVVLQDCWIDDFIQQTLDGTVVETVREAKLMNVTMKVVDGEWRVDGVTEATPESDGYEQCEELLS